MVRRFLNWWKPNRAVLFVSVEQGMQARIDRLEDQYNAAGEVWVDLYDTARRRIAELEAKNAALQAGVEVTDRALLDCISELDEQNAPFNAKWAERLHYVIEVWEVNEDGRFEYEAPGVKWPEQLDIYMEKYPQAWQKEKG